MVKVKLLFNGGSRCEVIVPTSYTIRQVLEENHVDYARGITNLDGTVIRGDALDRTLESFGASGVCMLSNVVKTENA